MPEAREHIDKARQCLTRARTILAAGVGEDAGRDAYPRPSTRRRR
jgi:hypothetical protein